MAVYEWDVTISDLILTNKQKGEKKKGYKISQLMSPSEMPALCRDGLSADRRGLRCSGYGREPALQLS